VGAASGTSKLTVNGGSIAATGATATVLYCTDTATVFATGLTVTGAAGTVVEAQTSCTATLAQSMITNLTGTAFSQSGSAMGTVDTVDIGGGLPVSALGGVLTVKNGTFSNSTADAFKNANATIVVNGTTIQGCGRYAFEYSSGSVSAAGMTVSGCGVGGIYSEAALTMRSCTIKNNVGTGVYGLGSISFDLGSGTSTGSNTFTSNSVTNVDVSLTDVSGVPAVGNTWNALVQGSDSAGHYGTGASSGYSASGTNFKTGTMSSLALGP
jgi:hypothetical protein